MEEQPVRYPAQEQHNSINHGMYLYKLSMYQYILVCTWYILNEINEPLG
jgi:hypothetical protein